MNDKNKIYVVGIGPGNSEFMTKIAKDTIKKCDVIVGYDLYVDLVSDLTCGKEILSTPMKQEVKRCEMALQKALEGKNVAFVCSGDAGVYGMAGVMYEVARTNSDVSIEIIAGVTAASSGASVLGAPLIHDFSVISLSDLLTPIDLIEKRVKCAAMGDFVICFYNPKSIKRSDYLKNACKIILENRNDDVYCGYVKNIGRDGEYRKICTIKELMSDEIYNDIDMFTTVFIGNSQTTVIKDKLVTPRGYKL